MVLELSRPHGSSAMGMMQANILLAFLGGWLTQKERPFQGWLACSSQLIETFVVRSTALAECV